MPASAEIPRVDEVAAGVHRLSLPLRGHSIGHVNIYALETASEVVLIDCGWSTLQTRRHLALLLRRIGRRTNDIRMVLLTHCHSDHAGMAGWLRKKGAAVGAHRGDTANAEHHLDAREFVHQTARWHAWAGVPEGLRAEATRYALHQHDLGWRDRPDFELNESSVLTHGTFRLQTIAVPGHTSDSVAFLETSTGLLFTGDTLFGQSNFGPSLRTLHHGDPMSDYLVSIEKLTVAHVTRVLPGHNSPFTDVRSRVAANRAHHLRRADIVAGLVAHGSSTAWSIAERIPRRRSWSRLSVPQRIAATAEVSAHLARLASLGHVPAELAPMTNAIDPSPAP
ncbi:MBL fold metallo-hydrolase [Microbacterium pygmaeum]|uniref:Glyoxylase, beta-lactamase superfamily II n=1 Tax=Microbacterium pygmaeum TaxID=370764 RepID=A0A1G7XKP4_9MICO|nr:MBL fold metallo-hydrolase [Microbacterium pygmaeum]SDG84769.1 Glyoxylase, beta-lactamase superfamily II [Microbacterium pygmaeum]